MTDCRYLVRSAESDPKNSVMDHVGDRPNMCQFAMRKHIFASVLLRWRGREPPANAQMQMNCLDREMLIQKLVRYNV